MVFPITNYSRVWVRGKIIDLAKAAREATNYGATGPVQFTPTPSKLKDNATGQIIAATPLVVYPSGVDGSFAIQLPATNDPDISPLDWNYRVIDPSGPDPYYISVPYDTPVLSAPGDPLNGQRVIELASVSPDPTAENGFVQVVNNNSVVGAAITGTDHLVLTMSDGSTLDAGVISGGTSAETEYVRGVNLSGAEFAPAAATLPGTVGTDYSYPASAEFVAMAARGHRVVRIPFRWERIQPTRAAALNSAELTRLQTAITNANTAGLQVILDVHNYGRYINSVANGGAELILGSTALPGSDFVDLWTRLSAAFKDNTAVYAYGLMNEPHDFLPVSGSFSGTVRYDWNGGTVQGWTGDTSTATNVSSKLRLSKAVGSGNVNARKDDAATVQGGSTPTGNVLRAEMTLVSGSPAGTWGAHLEWQNSSFTWQTPTSVTYTRVDTGAVVSGLITGVAVYVTCTYPSITSPPQAFAIQIDGTGVSAGTVTVDVDNFSQGTVTGAKTGSQVWESISQDAVYAIRGSGDTKKILVAGYGYSGAKTWATNHTAPWITGGGDILYEAHYYFDSDNSGDYPDTYSTENSLAISGGHASLTARALTELGVFTSWLNAYSVSGFIGEIGWPNTADTSSWNAVANALYSHMDAHNLGATYWSAGSRWGTSYNLSAYTGTLQDTVKAQASVIEAHTTSYLDASGQISSLSHRVDVLELGGSKERSAPPHQGSAWMVIGAVSPSELATVKGAGATHGLVEVFWDQCQSTAGGPVDASGVNAQIQNVLTAGLKVCLRVCPQYPPSFVQSAVPPFKRQDGATHTAAQSSGANVRDWVWSKTGRDYLADFMTKLFTQLNWANIERVQVGGLLYGELQYPDSNGTTAPYWWGYSAPAQTGTDLAARMAVCPNPGYVPSGGTTWTDADDTWVTWYQQSLINFMVWLIEQHRKWFNGPIWVMHPGAGLRDVSQTPTSSTQGTNYRINNAKGLDWSAQLGSYPDANVHPYSTWADSDHFWTPAPYSGVNDGNAAPWWHLLRIARTVGRAGRIWGENTGGQSNTDMNRVFSQGAVAFGFEGLTWLSYASLTDGTSDTLANLTTWISAS